MNNTPIIGVINPYTRELAGTVHAFECFGAVELDHAVARFDAILGGDTDVLSHCA